MNCLVQPRKCVDGKDLHSPHSEMVTLAAWYGAVQPLQAGFAEEFRLLPAGHATRSVDDFLAWKPGNSNAVSVKVFGGIDT